MSRLSGTILDGVSFNSGREAYAPAVDVSLGGQYGYQPNGEAYVNNAGYRPSRLIALLLETPRGFNYLPNPKKSIETLRALIETQSKQITGIRSGYNVEFAERPLDGAGRMQRDPSNVTEEISNPSHVWDERYGRAIHNFWKWYIRMLIADPITKQPGIMNLEGDRPTDHLPDLYSFSVLYIQPDPLRTRVEEAWVQVGMVPNTSGVLESQFDVTAATDVPEINIEFGGVPFNSNGIMEFAQAALDSINYVNASPINRKALLDKIQADILAGNNGYREDIASAVSNSVG